MNRSVLLLAAIGALAACSGREPAAPAAPATPAPEATVTPAASAPVAAAASLPAAPGASAAASAAAASSGTVAAAPSTARHQPLSAQGTASAGVTVRVQGIELGPEATVLRVNISYAGRSGGATALAQADTFLADDRGNRLMLKRPEDNRDLAIRDGETMEGELVFQGAVPPGTKSLKLVFNENSAPDNAAGPGLVIALPLQ